MSFVTMDGAGEAADLRIKKTTRVAPEELVCFEQMMVFEGTPILYSCQHHHR